MPDKPKDPPTYEEIERELGPDMMSFMSEMLRPDAEDEREDDQQVPQASQSGLTPEEQKLIDLLEWSSGRKYTPEQVHNALRQAREIGEL